MEKPTHVDSHVVTYEAYCSDCQRDVWDEVPPDSLDAAWAEAEAALPEGWKHLAVRREAAYVIPGDQPWRYVAEAGEDEDIDIVFGHQAQLPNSPAAALRALAVKLREG